MKQLKQYSLVAAGDGTSGGQILIGSDTLVPGAIAATDTVGLSEGAQVRGQICAFKLQGSVPPHALSKQKNDSCPKLSSLHHEIRQLSASLKQVSTPVEGVLSARVLHAGPAIHVEKLVLQSGEILWLEGKAGQTVTVNIHGQALFEQGASVQLRGGIRPQDVFFNFLQAKNAARIEIDSGQLAGTYVSDGRVFRITDQDALRDARFYTTANIQLVDLQQEARPVIQEDADTAAQVVNVSAPVSPLLFLLLLMSAVCIKRAFKNK